MKQLIGILGDLLLLVFGTYRLMREWGAPASLAWSCLLLLPASIAFQLLGISVKGDLLAAALSIWGLVATVVWHNRRWSPGLPLACLLFTAAILTKFTVGFAVTAMVIWLGLNSKKAQGGLLVAGTAGCTAIALIITSIASDGRFAESFAACATGGLNFEYAVRFPLWFCTVAVQDPFFLIIFMAAVGAAVRRFGREGFDLVICYFAVTTVGTLGIFISPGTDSNHLIDLLVASLVLLAVELSSGGYRRSIAWIAGISSVAVVSTWIPGMPSVRNFLIESGRPTHALVQRIADQLPSTAKPRILAENPLVPILMGQRPEVMDCFSLRLIASQTPAIRERFMADLTAKKYTAIILTDWSGANEAAIPTALAQHTSMGAKQFYGEVHFPAGFLDHLWRNYRLSFVVKPFVIFEPR